MAQLIYTFGLDGTHGKAYSVRTQDNVARLFKVYLKRRNNTGWHPVLHGTRRELEALGAYESVSGAYLMGPLHGFHLLCNVTGE